VQPGPDIDALKDVLRRGPPLRLALLFGSGARGELRPDSDLDVGIVPADPAMPFHAEADLQIDLERTTGRKVDLVRLDKASTLLRGQVARDAQLLLESREGEFRHFRAAATIEYLDFLPLYDAAAERFRQSLLRLAKAPR
jgi:predicted nucleotidyltransferase